MSPPRLRMFAGPNGSGKSTIKARISRINSNWLGVYINPDEIESEIASTGQLNLAHFKVRTNKTGIFNFLHKADQLIDNGLVDQLSALRFTQNSISLQDVSLNSYWVSAIADFLHERLVVAQTSFSFETVMSHPKKIQLLKTAQNKGFRNYLYYVATEDPEINISRVQIRVKEGGHDVPRKKVVDRYYRSMDNLLPAIRMTSRSFIYDNSGAEATLIAEVTDGKTVEIKNSNIPVWVKKYLLDKSR